MFYLGMVYNWHSVVCAVYNICMHIFSILITSVCNILLQNRPEISVFCVAENGQVSAIKLTFRPTDWSLREERGHQTSKHMCT